MYKNVGKKIQLFSKIGVWVGSILFVLFGVFYIVAGMISSEYGAIFVVLGIMFIIFGPLLSWVGSLNVYGFGKLVEDNEYLKSEISQINSKIKSQY